jgi:[ribosomal protein S5]-alanine N-acetyltransferase
MDPHHHRPLDRGAAAAQQPLGVAARVYLERPAASSKAEYEAAVRRSGKLHAPWVTAPPYKALLRRRKSKTHVHFLVRRKGSRELVGMINVSEIVRGALRSAYLGYCAFAPHQRQGLMTEGLRLAIARAFGGLRLHRVEASIQPRNKASRSLVRKLGFRREGYSPRYLKIRGRWRDHERWALLADA